MTDYRKAPRLRVVNEGLIAGPKTRIYLVEHSEAGETLTDLSSVVSRVAIDLTVGEVATASLTCFCDSGTFDAVLDDLVIQHVGHNRRRRLLWQIKNWWWRAKPKHREVTAMADVARKWVES